MRKMLVLMLILAGLACPALFPCAAESAPAASADEDIAEWTVLLYFCGSDLESKYAYASLNLKEIQEVQYSYDYLPLFSKENTPPAAMLKDIERVNILLETGGARKWHTEGLDMEMDTHAIQRWQLSFWPDDEGGEAFHGFELLETIPRQSMADPGTLTDFIRWGVETAPAKKYCLVLWDHGDGAYGMFIDELFDGDEMYIYELDQALDDCGVTFETIVIDACLMANIETAWALRDNAKWLVASEETVPGKGTAFQDWLQALIHHPTMDGEWLGRCVCDMTAVKYANEADNMAKSLMTWSVIDLSKIDKLISACGNLFRLVGNALKQSPGLANLCTKYICKAEEYGSGLQNMRDLGSLIYFPQLSNYIQTDYLDQVMNALQETVVYISRGSGRSEARGLSFCYPADFTADELNIYARNFPEPYYLSYLDAITEWTAPDWVYEQVNRVPEIDDIDAFRVVIEKKMTSSGMPALCFKGTNTNLDDLYFRLYKLNEGTGEIERLGITDCGIEFSEDFEMLLRPSDPMHWPAIDGEICCIDLVQSDDKFRLYNIPIQINSENAILRCGRKIDGETSEYEVYGIWNGYDDNSTLMSRSVEELAMVAGRKYRLLYPVEGKEKDDPTSYANGPELKMYRQLDVGEVTLPAGIYYIQYELRDMFMRTMRLEMIEIHWDGETMTFPEGFTWEGSVEPKWER